MIWRRSTVKPSGVHERLQSGEQQVTTGTLRQRDTESGFGSVDPVGLCPEPSNSIGERRSQPRRGDGQSKLVETGFEKRGARGQAKNVEGVDDQIAVDGLAEHPSRVGVAQVIVRPQWNQSEQARGRIELETVARQVCC